MCLNDTRSQLGVVGWWSTRWRLMWAFAAPQYFFLLLYGTITCIYQGLWESVCQPGSLKWHSAQWQWNVIQTQTDFYENVAAWGYPENSASLFACVQDKQGFLGFAFYFDAIFVGKRLYMRPYPLKQQQMLWQDVKPEAKKKKPTTQTKQNMLKYLRTSGQGLKHSASFTVAIFFFFYRFTWNYELAES